VLAKVRDLGLPLIAVTGDGLDQPEEPAIRSAHN
jgi:hypothetical protein